MKFPLLQLTFQVDELNTAIQDTFGSITRGYFKAKRLAPYFKKCFPVVK
jgi:hypothetical protein